MAKGLDSIQNGLIFGALVGAFVMYVALLPNNFVNFYADWIGKAVTWLQAQSWMSWASSFSMKTMQYALSIILGAIVGAFIDSR